jgi:steroid delta-isomerase-like uncharacterized protein
VGKREQVTLYAEDNAALVRRFYEEVFDLGNLDVAEEFLAADVVEHDVLSHEPPGLEGFKKSIANLLSAFPDLSVTLEDVISVEDKVVVRWTDRGTHKGEFLGMAPTGRRVITQGISIFRFSEGKIAEQWTNWDTLSLMSQLGARDRLPRDLIGRMLSSQEEERRRVAYEVHDGPTQVAIAAHQHLQAFADNHPPGSTVELGELDRALELA